MSPFLKLLAIASVGVMPQISAAATFIMTDLQDNRPYDCDWICYFSGDFDATDLNRDGYITTDEVTRFDAQASYVVIYKSYDVEYFVTAESSNPVDTFEISYKIGDPLIESLRFTSDDYTTSCASEKGSSDRDVLLLGDNEFISKAGTSQQTTYPFYDPYRARTWCGEDYGDGDFRFYYRYETEFGGFQAGVTEIIGDPLAPVPLPATGLLLLGGLGLASFMMRGRAATSDK